MNRVSAAAIAAAIRRYDVFRIMPRDRIAWSTRFSSAGGGSAVTASFCICSCSDGLSSSSGVFKTSSLHQRSHRTARIEELTLGSAGIDAQYLRDFCVRESLYVVQHDDGSVAFGQQRDGAPNVDDLFTGCLGRGGFGRRFYRWCAASNNFS